MKRILGILTALLALQGLALGQTATGCSSEESHQFDFWIGDWDVTSDGAAAGTNRIEAILDGCVLQEHWSGAQGSAGSSLNHYDPSIGKWRQYWVWRNGTTLELTGEYRDGKMVLAGDSKDAKGKSVRNRITWYDNGDGTVRQHWEQSADRGKTWTTSFDGLYRGRK